MNEDLLDDDLRGPGDWDPAPHQRIWYKSRQGTGDRGWLVVRDGIDHIKLDRPNQEILRPFNSGSEWERDLAATCMTIAQVAQVCVVADRQLCIARQLFAEPRKEWLSMSDREKQLWMTTGPTKHPERAALYRAIREALSPLVG